MEKRDIRIVIDDVKFGCRAVGVLIKNNKVLFQKRKNDEYWALPGGAIEVLEKSKDVIVRELYEEIGVKNIEVIRPLWFVENFFVMNNTKWHQYIIGYLLNCKDEEEILNLDEFNGIEEGKNIIYKWIDIKDIASSKIKPDFLKNRLLNIKNEIEFLIEEE